MSLDFSFPRLRLWSIVLLNIFGIEKELLFFTIGNKALHSVTSWSRLAIDSWHNILGNSPCSRLHYFCLLALLFLQLWVLSRSSSSLMRSVGWKCSQCNALPSTKAWPIAAWNAPLRFVLNRVVPCESCSCRPVAGGGAGGAWAPPDVFRLE